MQKPEGRIVEIVNQRKLDVEFPPDHRPNKYNIVEVYTNSGILVGKATVWRDPTCGPVWEDFNPNWVRCWGNAANMQPGYRVVDTGKTRKRAKYLDQFIKAYVKFLHSTGYPKSDLTTLKFTPPLDDPQLLRTLNEVLDGVVNKLGYSIAMLATHGPNDEFPLRLIRSKPWMEWLWDLSEEVTGISPIGRTLILKDTPNNITTQAIMRAKRGERNAYSFTHSLYELWDYVYYDPRDKPLVWAYQLTSGIMSIVSIPFYTIYDGKPVILGNMFAGHRKWRLSKRDIAALNAFVEQASLTIQKEELIKFAQDRATKAEDLAVRNWELKKLAEDRAEAAETMAGMMTYAYSKFHRIVNIIGDARLDMIDYIEAQNHQAEIQDLTLLSNSLSSIEQTIQIIDEIKRPFRKVENPSPTSLIDRICIARQELEKEKILPPTIAITMDEAVRDAPAIQADHNLAEVFKILFKNAAEAINGQGTIQVKIKNSKADQLIVSVSDTGPGIDSSVKDELFDFFSSTKEDKGGAGLGLAWVKFYLRKLGGDIMLNEEADTGATFDLRLPVVTNNVERTA